MANTILGIFDDPAAAQRGMDELRASKIDLIDMSVISPAGTGATGDDHLGAGEGAAMGAVWGGLVGLAALLIPGVGPFIAGGALFAALTGAATGAVVGGVASALMDSAGLEEEEARNYEARVHGGKTLVAVKVRDEDAIEVRRILANAGANSIRDNQAGLTGTNTPVKVALGDVASSDIAQELEAAVSGGGATAGTQSATTAARMTTMPGPAGIHDVPTTYPNQSVTGIYAAPTTRDADAASPRGEANNMAAGAEDPYGTPQVSPGDAGRAIVTEGWERVGHTGDRQGEKLTPSVPEKTGPQAVPRRQDKPKE